MLVFYPKSKAKRGLKSKLRGLDQKMVVYQKFELKINYLTNFNVQLLESEIHLVLTKMIIFAIPTMSVYVEKLCLFLSKI